MPIVRTARRVEGSILVTVPSRKSPTQIAPSPAASAEGSDPTGMEATTRFVFASTAAQ